MVFAFHDDDEMGPAMLARDAIYDLRFTISSSPKAKL